MTTDPSSGERISASPTNCSLALGVDGGGTKTVAWIGTIDSAGTLKITGRGNAGSSNEVAVGAEVAFQNLAVAIDQACAEAEISLDSIAAGVFALAGSANEAARRKILHFVEQKLQIPRAQLIHDGQAVLEAGTPDGHGIALIAGTGAVAYGRNPEGDTAVVGGWGYWFGDEGSAYWLGQQALSAISHAADGRAASTELTAQVLERLAIDNPREILSTLSAHGEVRSAIASLAQLVCETAQNGDEVATSILDRAAEHWTKHVVTLAEQLKLPAPVPIALAGGVLCGSGYARAKLLPLLDQQPLTTSSIELVQEPVEGCVRLASRSLEKTLWPLDQA